MRVELSHYDGPIVAEARHYVDSSSVLHLVQGGSRVGVALPRRMAACVDMIVEAFNAHMQTDAKTLEAQGVSPLKIAEKQAGKLAPVNWSREPDGTYIGLRRGSFGSGDSGPLDGAGVDLAGAEALIGEPEAGE